MAERTLVQAVRDALAEEMERDPRVCVLGEDVGRKGGVCKATAGLERGCPSTPADATGLVKRAVRDPDPVIFLEPKKLYRAGREEVAEGDGALRRLGEAALVRAGSDVTAITYGYLRVVTLQAAAR